MKILHVNKFFAPEYGTEKYLFAVTELLRANGHEVEHFAMRHPKNAPSKFEQHFVSPLDLSRPSLSWQGLKALARMLYSREASKKFTAVLDEFDPDIVHVHSIHHQISPSILLVAKRRGIPIVQTLHDHKLICPSYHFPFRDGRVCIRCSRGHWLHLLLHRAHKDSFLATLAVVIESGVHSLGHIYERTVDRFIVLSRDMAQRLVEFGLDPTKATVMPLFVAQKPGHRRVLGQGVLFAGRLAPERGLEHVLYFAKAVPKQTFYVAGDGPERSAFEARLKLQGITNIRVLGYLSDAALAAVYKKVRVLIYPTLTFEVFGLTMLEAMANSLPVVATRLGAVTERVTDGVTGLLYDPQLPEQGLVALKKVLTDDHLAQALGADARTAAQAYNPMSHYQQLMQVYADVLAEQARQTTYRELKRVPIWREATT